MNLKELPDDILEIVIRKACPASFLWLLFVDKHTRNITIHFKFPEKDDRYKRLYFQNRLVRTLSHAIVDNDRDIASGYMHDHHWMSLIKYGYTCCITWLIDDPNRSINTEALIETCRICNRGEIESLLKKKKRKKTYNRTLPICAAAVKAY